MAVRCMTSVAGGSLGRFGFRVRPGYEARVTNEIVAAAAALAPAAPIPRGQRPQPERVEFDEARRILLIVGAAVVLEGDERRRIERLRALSADDDHIALVQLEPHLALDMLLRLVDQGLQHLALWTEPEAIINQLGIARHQLVLEMPRSAVERDAFHRAMGGKQYGAARRLIDAARFHSDEPVLDEIDAADSVVTAKLIQPRQQGRRREPLAVEADGVAPFAADADHSCLVGGVLGADGPLINDARGLDRRVLEDLALGWRVPQAGGDGEGRFALLVLADR